MTEIGSPASELGSGELGYPSGGRVHDFPAAWALAHNAIGNLAAGASPS